MAFVENTVEDKDYAKLKENFDKLSTNYEKLSMKSFLLILADSLRN